MAVYSMTGYASVQQVGTPDVIDAAGDGPQRASPGIEIRSVNSRFLDLSLRLPEALREHEPALRELLAAHCRRGKVELRVTTEAAHRTPAGAAALPSPQQLQRLGRLQETVRGWLPDAAPLSVADALRWCSTLADEDDAAGAAAIAPAALLALARRAVDALLAARAAEGARLAAMLHAHVAELRRLAGEAEPLVPRVVEQQRERFLQRWQEALDAGGNGGSGVSADAARERALAEATAFALRIDVAEELVRLASHLDEIDRLLDAGGAIGKRLEFLIQELQREANTLGSKSAALELSRVAVEMKVLVEQMREQVQNVE